MTDAPLSHADLEALAAFDTPTVCNALESVMPERRAVGFTVQPLVAPFPDAKPIVAYARTATIRSREPARDPKQHRANQLRWYEYVASGARPSVAVLHDLDGPFRGYGAFWGEVQTNVHQALGCVGTVTDGAVRDIEQMAKGFFVLAGSIAPSHAWVHVEEIGVAVSIAGMAVGSDDLIHADRHGAVVVPLAAARKIPEAARRIARREAVLLEAARRPGFSVEDIRRALAAADEIH